MSRILSPHRGERTTDRMLAALRGLGHRTVDFNYDPVFFFQTRSWRRQIGLARQLREIVETGDVVVAHSMGCLIAFRAMEIGAEFSDLFFFRPAMNRNFTFPRYGMQRTLVVHCPEDEALRAGALLQCHPFGRMGILGYNGPRDERIENTAVHYTRSPNHSAEFEIGLVQTWARFVDDKIRERNQQHNIQAAAATALVEVAE